ncbi:Hpt domain-containing protein [bacterium]|nr:Hpt domain-containing protein [bacterium]
MASQKCLIIIVLLISSIQVNLFANEPGGKPLARKGVINLATWDLIHNGPLALDGEWEFYWKQLLNPDDFEDQAKTDRTVFAPVPGYWNDYDINGLEFGSNGYATYRLLATDVTPGQVVSLDISTINTAFILFVNGEIIARCGTVERSRELSKPHACPEILSFSVSKDTIEFIFQISNYHHENGGFWHGLTMGSLNDISRVASRRVALDLFLIGSIFIIGLYHLGLFRLRPKDPSTLFFGLFCLLIALRTSFHNATFFYNILPDFNWQLYLKMDYATLYLPLITFTLFFQRLYHQEFSKAVLKLIIFCSVIFGAITIVTPTYIFSRTLYLFQIIILLSCLYVLYVMILALIHKREGANMVLGGCLILIISVINDILHAQAIINTFFVTSSGLFAFIFSQAYVISQRSAIAFETAEILTMKLEQKVHDQTAAIRDLLDNTGQGIFSFGRDFIIQKYASKATQSIFGKVITGEHAVELLFPGKSSAIKGYLDVAFESEGKLRLVKDVLPVELKKKKQFYDISYRWIPPGKTTPGQIMVILTDVTVKRKLEKMLEKDEQRNQKIIPIAKDRYGFLRFYNSIQDQLHHIDETLKTDPARFSINDLSRIFHTIKGGTAAYGIFKVSNMAHAVESMFEEKNIPGGILTKEIIKEVHQRIAKMEELFQEELEEIGDLIPKELLQVSHTSFYTISETKVKQVEQLVKALLSDNNELNDAINNLRKQPMRNLMKKVISDAKDLAFQKGKQVEVHYSGERTEIIHAQFEGFFCNLIHLIRNAIDHGIESPIARKMAGKPETGILNIQVNIENGFFKMVFADDGVGIDIQAVKQKALEKRIITRDQHETMADHEAINLIFGPNFSTRDELTQISGRGIGMNAVYASIKELGGSVTISSELNKGTSFTILIPIES